MTGGAAVLVLPRTATGARRLGAEFAALLDAVGATGRARHRAEVVAEEVVTNLVKFGGPEGADTIRITARREDGRLTVTVTDSTPPFSPLDAAMPDGLASARDGGLGLDLVRRMATTLDYGPAAGGGNLLTLTFAEG